MISCPYCQTRHEARDLGPVAIADCPPPKFLRSAIESASLDGWLDRQLAEMHRREFGGATP